MIWTGLGRRLPGVVLVLVLTALWPPRPASGESRIHLRFQVPWPEDHPMASVVRELLDRFQSQNEGILVQLHFGPGTRTAGCRISPTGTAGCQTCPTGIGPWSQVIFQQVLGGTAADVVAISVRDLGGMSPPDSVPTVPMESLEGLGLADDGAYFPRGIWEAGRIQGQTYGYPWCGVSLQLIANQQLLERAGLIGRAPQYWEDLEKMAATIREKTGVYGIGLPAAATPDLGRLAEMFVYQAGGRLMAQLPAPEGGRYWLCQVSHLENQEALAALARLFAQSPPVSRGWALAEAEEAFYRGQVATIISGPWAVSEYRRRVPEGKLRVFEMPFGRITLKTAKALMRRLQVDATIVPRSWRAVWADVYLLCIPRPTRWRSGHLAAAERLVRFLGSAEAQVLLARGGSRGPNAGFPTHLALRSEIADHPWYVKSHPEYLPFLSGLSYPTREFRMPSAPASRARYWTVSWSQFPHIPWERANRTIWPRQIHAALRGQKPMRAALNEAENEVNSLLASYYTRIAHQSETTVLGMLLVAIIVFVVIFLAVGYHRQPEEPEAPSRWTNI